MMDIQHGTWGERVRTFKTDNALVTILWLKPWKRCSWHKHNSTYNQFYCIVGELFVKTDVGPNNQRQITKITPGQAFTVKPGVTHEFQTRGNSAIIEEIAYTKYDEADIHRTQLGGDIVHDKDK